MPQLLSLHLRYRMTRAARLANHLRIPRARAQHPVQPHHQLARDRHLGDPVVLFMGQAFKGFTFRRVPTVTSRSI